MEPLTISIESDNVQAQEQVRLLLETANAEIGYERNLQRFCAVLRNRDGYIQGGINAVGYWGWLYIGDLAVATTCRGRGYGRSLLASAEAWGLDCSCHDAWLSTLSFQARGFYERAGYRVFAELPNFPDQQIRFFLRKSLVAL
jgi:ribosomal protein S18 acetylase RimI-like enzyme